ncbi:MAG: cardiolipin synthase [Planctomycetaceae bacterium]
MMNWSVLTLTGTSLFYVLHLMVAARAILRPHREPSSRLAWITFILLVPGLGMVVYLLVGETSIGRRRIEMMRAVERRLPAMPPSDAIDLSTESTIRDRFAHLFRVGQSVNGFPAVHGNRARLMADSNSGIDSIVADIDAAREHVHLIFYIWLGDNNGLKAVEALKRAAARGVTCRVMADSLGSRLFLRSPHWRDMQAAGVHAVVALPIGNPFLKPLNGRIDLRNHRKLVVIDNRITYCGSQNCADPEFRIKPKFAPWVDVLMRFEGPIVWQNQCLFASDWMSHVEEDLTPMLSTVPAAQSDGFTAQVIGTGPTVRYSAMPEVFETLIYAAREEIFITTPYFVPNEAMLAALCASARRGISTRIILPAHNDSSFVAAASRSYYGDLLAAGVEIFEYPLGLLHAKTLTLDGQMTLVGSANMDRRSFDLNYENNILLLDRETTIAMRERQQSFLADSYPVTTEMVAQWPVTRRFWNNAVSMLGPIL